MAKCEIITIFKQFVPEPRPEPEPINEVVLRMTVGEAGTLKQVINHIGGDPEGPRGELDGINMSLYKAGVESTTHRLEIYYPGLGGVSYLRIKKKGE